jgi:hypothetical protein
MKTITTQPSIRALELTEHIQSPPDIRPAAKMGNVTSSLNTGKLDSVANVVEQAKSDLSPILDSLNGRGRNVASALLNTIVDAKSDPSAAFDSLKAHGQNVASSLTDTAKGARSNPLVANLLHSFREYWHMAVALLPVSRRCFYALPSQKCLIIRRKRNPSTSRCLVDTIRSDYCSFIPNWRVS